MTTNILSLARVLTVAAAFVPAVCDAQETYPARPVRFVVPFPPASPIDLLARVAAQKLTEPWGRPVVVENRIGANGTIALDQVVRATPDGYTLLFTPDFPIVIAPVLSKPPYDPRKDLAPIAAVAQSMAMLVVNPSVGVSSIKELIAAAKARPGALTFSSSGDASPSRMCIELIKQEAGIDLVHVPYKGAPPAMQAVLAGEVSMFCGPIFQGLPHVKSGQLKALGVTGAKPSSSLPELAPLSVQGLPNVIVSYWYGVFAPVGTPPAILNKIRDSLKKAFDDTDMRQKLAGAGLDPLWMNGNELAAAIRADLDKYTRVVKTAGIKPE
jgi:tripartite-type tricarboxylate transporter receptor subunit TctC